jgi:hypothetical protein
MGHPLNTMLALIHVFSRGPTGAITQRLLDTKEYQPWEKLFHLDLQLANKDDIDWFFVLAMAHARTEIVRQEEVWWRLRLVEPRLTNRVENLKLPGVLERLWLLGIMGRTIYPREFAGQPARFLEFFHANLRDYLLSLMGRGGGEIELPRRRCEMPPAWRALDRLAAAAHEWEQAQQLLDADDVASLLEQREVAVERYVRGDGTEQPPFHLLFLRDVETARPRLCRAAAECLAFSALVHDTLGRWAVEQLFGDVDDRVKRCAGWLSRCARDSRAPVLRYLIESKTSQALQYICRAVLAAPGPQGWPATPADLWKDVATLLNRPLYAARYRPDVAAAVLEAAVAQAPAARATLASLPDRVREFVAVACNADPNELTQLVSHCVDRFKGSQDLKLQYFAESLAAVEHATWLAELVPDPALYSALDPRERAGRTEAPLQLCPGHALRGEIPDERLNRWRGEVSRRLGIPLPRFDLAGGDLENSEEVLRRHGLELRLHGQGVAIGEFYPGRAQILQRHWRRTQTGLPRESWVTQNDALGEVVLWVDPTLLKEVSWERPAQDFDEAVVGWLEEVLRNAADHYFGFDLLAEFLQGVESLRDTGRLFRVVSLQLLRQVVVNLVQERVPLAEHRAELVTALLQLGTEVKDAGVLTENLRYGVRQALCRSFLDGSAQLAVLPVEKALDDLLAGRIVAHESGRFLAIDPVAALALASEVREHLELHRANDVYPVLACSPVLRHPLSGMLRRYDPRIVTLSHTELPEYGVAEVGWVGGRPGGPDSDNRGGARA